MKTLNEGRNFTEINRNKTEEIAPWWGLFISITVKRPEERSALTLSKCGVVDISDLVCI